MSTTTESSPFGKVNGSSVPSTLRSVYVPVMSPNPVTPVVSLLLPQPAMATASASAMSGRAKTDVRSSRTLRMRAPSRVRDVAPRSIPSLSPARPPPLLSRHDPDCHRLRHKRPRAARRSRARARAVDRADRPPHRGPARGGEQHRRRAAERWPRAARGRAWTRENAARAHGGRGARPLLLARAVHAGLDAERHHGHRDAGGGSRERAAQLQVRARADLRERGARRRDQPRAAENPGRAAAGDAGARGHRERADARAPRAVLRARDAESHRAGGHLSAPRGAARSLHVRAPRGLPLARGGGCLLYTSDAADDLLCVDLGGRRII